MHPPFLTSLCCLPYSTPAHLAYIFPRLTSQVSPCRSWKETDTVLSKLAHTGYSLVPRPWASPVLSLTGKKEQERLAHFSRVFWSDWATWVHRLINATCHCLLWQLIYTCQLHIIVLWLVLCVSLYLSALNSTFNIKGDPGSSLHALLLT